MRPASQLQQSGGQPPQQLPPSRVAPLRAISALILREMGATYGRSPGGYLWAILEPVGAILVLTVIFSVVLRTPPIGTSFVLFYASGVLPYTLFMSISVKVQSSLRYSRALLAYPRVTWLDAVLARFTLNLLTGLMVMSIVWSGIMLLSDTHTNLDIVPILTGLAIAALLGLGVGMMNALLMGLFPLWVSLWGIITRPLLIASGVLFLFQSLPRSVQEILWWNPLIHVTGLVRSGFYSTYNPSYISLGYCFGLALTLIALGLVFLRAWYKTVLEE